MLLGAHVSTAGGLHLAPERGASIGAEAIQIFTRNQVQWRAAPIRAAEARRFRGALEASGIKVAMSHGSYLVNLASPDASQRRRSRDAFTAELRRCQALGIRYLVFHPGAHMGAGEEPGLEAVARGLDAALERAAAPDVEPLLEVTAGQGSSLGHRFAHLATILARMRHAERIGVCLDTCHLLAAGYPIDTQGGYQRTLAELEECVGLRRVRAFHLNDARRERGSRVDRHAPIGEGHLGRAAFRRLLRDSRFAGCAAVLETPGGMTAWQRELRLLRRMRRRSR